MPTDRPTRPLARIVIVAAAALALAACGETQDSPDSLEAKADAAIDGKGVADAIRASVDEQAIEGAIRGAASDAIREAIPADELGVIGTVIDEEALVSGIDNAVDGKALTGAVTGAVTDAVKGTGRQPAQAPTE